MKIAGVRFPENWRIYDFDATDVAVSVGDSVIVESDRGQGFARVVRVREAEAMPVPTRPAAEQKVQNGKKENGREQEEEIEIEVETPGSAAKSQAQQSQPQPPAKGQRKVLRKATEEDLRKAGKNREREAEAYKICQDLVTERELAMKLIRAEYSFDATRVTFFFFSENRIDFRDLVKDLAHKLRSRIEMRQVGVRDVARMIGGFGPCGRELCCTSYLRGFEPVSIRMAKKQEMVLNPAKISGVCGRLLCCLSYEFSMYDEIKKDIAGMKEAANREKLEEKERKLAEERREAEERKLAEDQQRKEDDRRRQEQKREKPKAGGDQQREGRRPEKRREGQQDQKDQKQRQPQEQKQRDKQQGKQPQKQQQRQQQQRQPQKQQPRPDQQPRPEQQAGPDQQQLEPGQEMQEGQQPAEKTGGGRRRRRFWKKKKKGGGQPGGGQPAGGAPQPPSGS